MNSVDLVGRLVRDPEVKYTSGTQTAMAIFNIAIDRPQKSEGGERQADFPRIIAYGKQAETAEKYLRKGKPVAIQGRLQTGSYQNRHGETVYTTDVVANRIEFLPRDEQKAELKPEPKPDPRQVDFAALDEDIPF